MASWNRYPTAQQFWEVFRGEAHGINSNYANCKLNPGHKDFMSVQEFETKHLSRIGEFEKKMWKNVIDKTVKITVSSTSSNRPDTFPGCQNPYPFIENKGCNSARRFGTGFIKHVFEEKEGQFCPCLECKQSNQPKMNYWEIEVGTATHVVFDDVEAESVIVDLFYDTDDGRGVKHLYGFRVDGKHDTRYQTDVCDMMCVTHDAKLMNRLRKLDLFYPDIYLKNQFSGMIISHPHGGPKKIYMSKSPFENQLLESNIKLPKGARVSISLNQNQHERKRKKMNDTPKGKLSPTSRRRISLFDIVTAEDGYCTLNEEIELSLPPNTPRWVDFTLIYYRAPTGTKCVTSNGEDIEVPKETLLFSHSYTPQIVTYDIDTCPGSSGAKVWDDNMSMYPHFGVNGARNRQCLL